MPRSTYLLNNLENQMNAGWQPMSAEEYANLRDPAAERLAQAEEQKAQATREFWVNADQEQRTAMENDMDLQIAVINNAVEMWGDKVGAQADTSVATAQAAASVYTATIGQANTLESRLAPSTDVQRDIENYQRAAAEGADKAQLQAQANKIMAKAAAADPAMVPAVAGQLGQTVDENGQPVYSAGARGVLQATQPEIREQGEQVAADVQRQATEQRQVAAQTYKRTVAGIGDPGLSALVNSIIATPGMPTPVPPAYQEWAAQHKLDPNDPQTFNAYGQVVQSYADYTTGFGSWKVVASPDGTSFGLREVDPATGQPVSNEVIGIAEFAASKGDPVRTQAHGELEKRVEPFDNAVKAAQADVGRIDKAYNEQQSPFDAWYAAATADPAFQEYAQSKGYVNKDVALTAMLRDGRGAWRQEAVSAFFGGDGLNATKEPSRLGQWYAKVMGEADAATPEKARPEPEVKPDLPAPAPVPVAPPSEAAVAAPAVPTEDRPTATRRALPTLDEVVNEYGQISLPGGPGTPSQADARAMMPPGGGGTFTPPSVAPAPFTATPGPTMAVDPSAMSPEQQAAMDRRYRANLSRQVLSGGRIVQDGGRGR